MSRLQDEKQIAIIGLGYVGLPLAVEFGKKFKTVGFDINAKRIAALKEGIDSTHEVDQADLLSTTQLSFTTQLSDIKDCNFFIVTVPTPVDHYKRPDFAPVISATQSVASVLKKGDIVIYESTVYPGATEEICVPLLETGSGLVFNRDFFIGYSPERINPGDRIHHITRITKIVSGSTPEALDCVDALYSAIVLAGTHRAESIQVAEAAKVIENTQRDINIAFINELAILFQRLGIDTEAVLKATGTKWNALNFKPGLVGGHCIGVDPYYLTHKAQAVGYHPEIILAGRRINDNMGSFVAEQVVKLMTRKRIQVVDANILILGVTFKENCPDIRNTRVVDIARELGHYHAHVHMFDPWASGEEFEAEYHLNLQETIEPGMYDAIILAVSHEQFKKWSREEIKKYTRPNAVVYDVKQIWPRDWVDGRL